MLVLTRKVGEGIKIDDQIFVRVIQVKGKQVRIGIEAPKETKIHREELGDGASPKPVSPPSSSPSIASMSTKASEDEF